MSKDTTLRFMVTEEQAEQIRQNAEAKGCSMSEYVRAVALNSAELPAFIDGRLRELADIFGKAREDVLQRVLLSWFAYFDSKSMATTDAYGHDLWVDHHEDILFGHEVADDAAKRPDRFYKALAAWYKNLHESSLATSIDYTRMVAPELLDEHPLKWLEKRERRNSDAIRDGDSEGTTPTLSPGRPVRR